MAFLPSSIISFIRLGALSTLLGLVAALATPLRPAWAQAGDTSLPAGGDVRTFDIPAGPLDAALDRFARAAGVNLSYDAAAVLGVTTNGLSGSYGIYAGLSALLANSGLQAVARPGGGYTLQRPGVDVPGAGSRTDVVMPPLQVTAGRELPGALPKPYPGGQVAKGARLGVLGNVEVMDAPFTVTAYTAQTITDQQSVTVADVLRNDASVRYTTSDGHNAENFTVRGFDVTSTDLAFNGMYNLLPGTHVPTGFLERVEVFRGPSAMLSGISPNGLVGGVINLVPKRAGDEPLARLSAGYLSSSRFGAAADLGRRFGDEKQLGVRFNASASDGDTTLDGQRKSEWLLALGLDWRADRWKLELDAYVTRQDQSNGSPVWVGFGAMSYVLPAPDPRKNMLRGTYVTQQTEGVALRGEVELFDKWSAWAAVGYSRYRYDGYLNGTLVEVFNALGDARAQTNNQAGFTHGYSAEVGVRGGFDTGPFSHQLTASYTYLRTRSSGGRTGLVTGAPYITNIYNPNPNPVLAGPHGEPTLTTDNIFTGLSFSDTISLWGDRVLLTLGVRSQRVQQVMASPRPYDESAITPLAGLVVKPWGPSISLFGNYIEGLSPGLTVGITYANAGDVLPPYRTRQFEAGIKWDTGTFTSTLSLFQIDKPSTVSLPNPGTLPILALDGMQRNRGIEWNVFGELAPSWRVLGGVTFIDARQIRASIAANNDKVAPGVPQWTLNLGTEWDVPWVSGLTLSTRVIYTSAQYLDDTNRLQIPGWYRWDLGARYVARIADRDVAFRASVENVTDSHYWSGRFYPGGQATLGAPLTVKLSTSVDF